MGAVRHRLPGLGTAERHGRALHRRRGPARPCPRQRPAPRGRGPQSSPSGKSPSGSRTR
jgi:hypothetical protein